MEKAAALFEQVTTAVSGLGAPRDGQTSLWHSLTEQEIAGTRAGDAISEICGMTYATDGRVVETPISRRAIGAGKADAIRGGIVKTLITHERCARAILKLVDAA